jgi:hypothetical protein
MEKIATKHVVTAGEKFCDKGGSGERAAAWGNRSIYQALSLGNTDSQCSALGKSQTNSRVCQKE